MALQLGFCLTWSETRRQIFLHNHSGEPKTQRKWFLDEKKRRLVDENRIINQQNEKQQKVYTQKQIVLSILFVSNNKQPTNLYLFKPRIQFLT